MVSRKDKTMKRTVSLLLVLVLLLTLCGCGKKDGGGTWQEQYDLGVRYLSDGNYEEAIIAFTAAIKIDSKRPEAYLGLADAYIGAGDLDAARKALEDGLVSTSSAELCNRLTNFAYEDRETCRVERRDLDNGVYDICEYDTQDKLARFTRYTSEDVLRFVYDYFYNINGINNMAEITYPSGERRIFALDSYGRTIVEIDQKADGDVFTDEFLYSGAKVTISLQMNSQEHGNISCSFPYVMSAENHEIDVYGGCTYNFEEKKIDYVVVAEHDEEDKQIAFNAYDGNGKIVAIQDSSED